MVGGCAKSAFDSPRRGAPGLWETGVAAFHNSVLFVSLIQLSGGSNVWEEHTLLYALTHPLPPKWEIINTHPPNTRMC